MEKISGTAGTLTWTLNNGTLTVSGEGVMPDYGKNDYAPWHHYRDSIITVIIENGVTSIGNWAFSGFSSLTSITIPNSVTNIGWEAFNRCSSLTSITIPDSVTDIACGDFDGCSNLISIHVKDRNEYYSSEDGVLFNKDKTTLLYCPVRKTGHYTIPNSVTCIEWGAFAGCSSLTSITIPNSVTRIEDDWAFDGCSSLISINVQGRNLCFSSENGVLFNKDKTYLICCPSQKAGYFIVIPNSVEHLGYCAFPECSSLRHIHVEDGNKCFSSKDGILFNKNKTRLIRCPAQKAGQYTVPDSVKSIESLAFAGYGSLTSVIISDGVESIGNCFSGCSGLISIYTKDGNQYFSSDDGVLFDKFKTVLVCCPAQKSGHYTVPDSVISIRTEAFSGCRNLTSITFPDSVTDIGNSVFSGCDSLMSVTNLNPVPQTLTNTVIDSESYIEIIKNITLYVPAESVELYKTAKGWKDFKTIAAYVPPEN
jgi:hypothetical protein